MCGAGAAEELVFDAGHSDFAGDWDWGEYGDFQRGGCVAAAAAAVSAAGPVGGGVVAFAGDWDFSGLAGAGAVCRFEKRESVVRTDGAGADSSCDADGARAAGAFGWDADAVGAADDAGGEGAGRTYAVAGGRRSGKATCGGADGSSVEEIVQR